MNLTTPDRPMVLVHDRVTGRLMRVTVRTVRTARPRAQPRR